MSASHALLSICHHRFARLTCAFFCSAFGLFEKDGLINRDDLGSVHPPATRKLIIILF